MFKVIENRRNLRKGIISTHHGSFHTPAFMPCATVGTVKSLSPDEVRELGTQIVLANAYHLYLRPGHLAIKKLGGLHRFMNWEGPILTDSGGFQIYSLSKFDPERQSSFKGLRGQGLRGRFSFKHGFSDKLAISPSLVKVRSNGVEFKSHLDGSKHFFTPEKVIEIQMALGSDILMPLDYCPSGNASKKEAARAVELTLSWAKRSWGRFSFKHSFSDKPALFAIVQGGIYPDLREYCAKELIKIGEWDGYAIGGLAVGENKKDMRKIVKLMNEILPQDKPRYLMGVGEPLDLLGASRNGMDMFDCVLPTRLARHGVVWMKNSNTTTKDFERSSQIYSKIDITKSKFKTDPAPIDKNCGCYTCLPRAKSRGLFSRAYLHHLMRENEILGHRLLTLHNLYFINQLMNSYR